VILASPFSEYKATELTDERIGKYFVEPQYIAKMYTSDVTFIIGQRGTGKTTMLKYLCTLYNGEDTGVSERLGIYYRFDINKMHSFSGSVISKEQWALLFAHCFSTEVCLELTRVLIKLKNDRPLKNEREICSRIRTFFYDDYEMSVSNLDDLQTFLEFVEYNAKRYKRNPLRVSEPMYSECEKAFEEFCYQIANDESYSDICIHFLFDEYENMLDYQKEYINTCIKNANCHHTFKVCVRPGGNNDMRTLSDTEILRQADDFKTYDYISDILGSASDVRMFMQNACKKRLEQYYKEKSMPYTDDDLDIERYFAAPKDDEIRFSRIEKRLKYLESVKKNVISLFEYNGVAYGENWTLMQMRLFLVLSMKRNFNFKSALSSFHTNSKQYTNWLNNYKRAVLWLCYSESNLDYEMSGFDDIVSISGNVVRYVLEICDYCFLSVDRDEKKRFNNVTERVQTKASYEISKRRFDQISTIPVYGQEIKQMVLVIGTIFAMYHRDSRLQRFEPNHFSIERKTRSELKYAGSRVERAINLGITYGVFESERATKSRGDADVPIEDEDIILHPILTPYFQVSWRRKQKCRFTLDEINDFLFGNDERISKLLKAYEERTYADLSTGRQSADEQISFYD
jgi:energy-coupling factor transporter ATP-binding protein EcfA2